MAPGGGAREGGAQGGAHGCTAGAAARRAGRFHVQQRRSRGAAALLVPLASQQGAQMQQGKGEGAGGGWFRKVHKAGAQGLRD